MTTSVDLAGGLRAGASLVSLLTMQGPALPLSSSPRGPEDWMDGILRLVIFRGGARCLARNF
jgi:hypothetical protein